MTRDERLSDELRAVTARGYRMFRQAGNGGPNAVDLLDEILRDIDRVASELSPRPSSPRAIPATEGRFSTGDIAARGRIIRVETRQRRRAA